MTLPATIQAIPLDEQQDHTERLAVREARQRLTAALTDLPDMASVTVLAGDLRKVLGL